jgi:putative transposase
MGMDWPRLLAYITGTVDQELLLRNEYLVAENRILKTQIKGRLLLSDSERVTLAGIVKLRRSEQTEQMKTNLPSYRGYRFPHQIISHAAWLYSDFA